MATTTSYLTCQVKLLAPLPPTATSKEVPPALPISAGPTHGGNAWGTVSTVATLQLPGAVEDEPEDCGGGWMAQVLGNLRMA